MNHAAGPKLYSLGGLASLIAVLAAVDSAAWLGSLAMPRLAALGEIAEIVLLIVLVTWTYRANVNAAASGCPQRHSPRWAIGAWLVPFAILYYPFQVMADIWRAGLRLQAREKRAVLPAVWWACFLLHMFLSQPARPVKIGPLTFYAGMPLPGKIAVTVTAVMTALVVHKVSRGPLGRPLEDPR